MGVHTLASGDLKGPRRDEVLVGVSWDGTAVQLEDSEWRDVLGSATEPSPSYFISGEIVVVFQSGL